MILLLLLVAVAIEAKPSAHSLSRSNETITQLPMSMTGFSYGLDITGYVTLDTFTCIYTLGYSAVFIQAYTSTMRVDPYVVKNIHNAHDAKLGIEIYISPATDRSSSTQVDDLIAFLRKEGITVSKLWLKVTSPRDWSKNINDNIEFIDSYIRRVLQYKITPGIFTNWYDWQQITRNWDSWSRYYSVLLWYWNAFGIGEKAHSSTNFDDFWPFSGYRSPLAKSFSLQKTECSVVCDQIVYSTKSMKYLSDVEAGEDNHESMIGFGVEIEKITMQN